jgi:putative SOS response-associated peptidase YedK
MCAHFESLKQGDRLARYFGVSEVPPGAHSDVWPGYRSVFLRRKPATAQASAPAGAKGMLREAVVGVFGLLPHWAKELRFARHTYNARAETAAEKPSFRDAWRKGQRCIVPAEAIFEPDWRSGKAVAARIHLRDGSPMGLAGLWSCWRRGSGEPVESFTLLTINADNHSFMRNYHRPHDEKRMVVVLRCCDYDAWLEEGEAPDVLRAIDAKELVGNPARTTAE